MKKIIAIVLSVVLALSLIGTGVFLYLKNSTHRPFKDLKADDVESISVELEYNYLSYTVDDSVKAEIVKLLSEIETPYFKEKTSDVTMLLGCPSKFTVLLESGKHFVFYTSTTSQPSEIVSYFNYNGDTYTSSYEQSQALSRIATMQNIKGRIYAGDIDKSELTPEQLEELGIEIKE